MILKAGNITKAINKAKLIVENEQDYRSNSIKYKTGKTVSGVHLKEIPRRYHLRNRISETYTVTLSKFPATQSRIGLPCARAACKRLIETDTYCISKRTSRNSVRDYFHIDCAVMLHIWPVDEEEQIENEPIQ